MSATPSQLTPDFAVVTSTIALPLNVLTVLLKANPNRFSFFIWPGAAATVFYAPQGQTAALLGFTAINTLPPFVWKFPDVGPVVCGIWTAISTGGAVNLNVTEVIYQPRSKL